jgi:hypothetical protein
LPLLWDNSRKNLEILLPLSFGLGRIGNTYNFQFGHTLFSAIEDISLLLAQALVHDLIDVYNNS